MIRRVHRVARTVFLMALTTFIVALIWEKGGGGVPCAFCRMERGVVLIGAFTAAFSFASREPLTQRLLLVSAFIWASGMLISFQHVGVQNHWFSLPVFCEMATPYGTSIEEIAQSLLKTPFTRCDQVTVSFLGQPPSVYLCLLMFGLLVTCFWGAAQPSLQEEIEVQNQHAEERCEWELEYIRQKEIEIRERVQAQPSLQKPPAS